MVEVKVLVEGGHRKNTKGDLMISATVTLIKTDKNIIVDPGSFISKDQIIKELKKEGLTPDDIEIVILTHLHLDHTFNSFLFSKAKLFCKLAGGEYPGQVHFINEGYLQRTESMEGLKIAKNVETIVTPGHTKDMISVVVETLKGKVIVAGDAFPSEEFLDLDKKPNPLISDLPEFDKSRDKILKIADYIVPGHGDIFKNPKKSD